MKQPFEEFNWLRFRIDVTSRRAIEIARLASRAPRLATNEEYHDGIFQQAIGIELPICNAYRCRSNVRPASPGGPPATTN